MARKELYYDVRRCPYCTGRWTITGVMPIHNEEEYLPYSLKALLKAPIDELIFIFDRCTDDSVNIVKRVKFPYQTIGYTMKEKKWRSPTAEPFYVGFSRARCDVVYSLAADCIFDPGIFTIDWRETDVACFKYHNSALKSTYKKFTAGITTAQQTANRLVGEGIRWLSSGYHPPFSGMYAFKRNIFTRLKHPDVASEGMWLLNAAYQHNCRIKYYSQFQNIHLRVGNPEKTTLKVHDSIKKGSTIWQALYMTVWWLNPQWLRDFLRLKYGSKEV